jgi:hypothetical protein
MGNSLLLFIYQDSIIGATHLALSAFDTIFFSNGFDLAYFVDRQNLFGAESRANTAALATLSNDL